MARVLYGVMGDARGHVSRSLAVAQSMAGHEFLFIGGDKVHLVKSHGYDVEEVPMARTIYRNTHVDLTATATNAIRVFLRRSPVVRRLAAIIREFDPHLILTDYEYFTPLAARSLGRPCISLDHQHILTHCDYEAPREQLVNRLLTCLSVKNLYSSADRFFIISFFALPPRDPATVEVFPPILRTAVKEHESSEGEHVLVYLGGSTFQEVLPVCLAKKKSKFIIYGMDERPPEANLVFKRHSQHGFLEDLADCRYVIATGGHSLISESLYFGKPILCFPISMAYEQYLNAYFVDRFGFGGYWNGHGSIDKLVDDFESRLEGCRSVIGRHSFFGNAQVAERLERLIEEKG
jgi:uncharacterized protein (TIGR00661 family)